MPTIGAEAFLLGVGGDHDGRVYPIWHNTALIGRSDDADVLVLDASVSARHAQLINGSQGFEIEDLGSTNGTQVEGRPVTRSVLQTGQLITIGQVEFKFLLHRRMDATLAVIPKPIQSPSPGSLIRQELPRPDDRPLYRQPTPSRAMSEDKEEEEGPSLEEIVEKVAVGYQYVRKNALLLGAFAAICAFLGLVSSVIIPPARQAECLLKLQPMVMANPVDPTHAERPADQEVKFFDSPETFFVEPRLVAGTLEKMLGHPLPDATVSSIAERLKLEPIADQDNMYRVSYREKLMGSLPLGPTQLLSAHLDNYLHTEIARAIRVFAAQADFLRDQLTSAEAEMNKISDQKMQFSQNNSDRLPDTASGTLTNRMDLEKRRADLSAQIRGLQGQLDAERHALVAEGPLAQSRFHASETYRTSLAEVNRKLSEAYAHGLADGHPEVRAIKEEKQRLEGLIAKEMETQTDSLDRASNAGFQDLQNRVALLQAQLSAARSDLADTEKDLKHVQNVVGDLPRVQAGVQHLVHMQEATTALHGQLFEQLKRAELQLKLERVSAESRYEVVKPPHLIATGRGKTAALRLTVGAAIGLLLGLATLGVRKLRVLFREAISNINATRTGTR